VKSNSDFMVQQRRILLYIITSYTANAVSWEARLYNILYTLDSLP